MCTVCNAASIEIFVWYSESKADLDSRKIKWVKWVYLAVASLTPLKIMNNAELKVDKEVKKQ